MKRHAFLGVSLTLIASLFASLVTTHGDAAKDNSKTCPPTVTQLKSDRGPKLAERIKQLRESNKDVRAALAAFEKNGF
jgi:hypothetical protein